MLSIKLAIAIQRKQLFYFKDVVEIFSDFLEKNNKNDCILLWCVYIHSWTLLVDELNKLRVWKRVLREFIL